MLSDVLIRALTDIVGPDHLRTDSVARADYGLDALQRPAGRPPDAVVRPGSTADVARVLRVCDEARLPVTPRGAGTGYSGGAVPVAGGVVLSLERLNRILEIDKPSLLAVVEPHVVTADLQRAVEDVGLFYPPDPASLDRSVIGGNVAECAGGPRAFKYGTTKRYVLGLQAVLPTGAVIRTGGRTLKNVVGYDLTQLLVGSEGTLAVVTEITLRLLPRPVAAVTVRAEFPSVAGAAGAVDAIVAAGVVPASVELLDGACLGALATRRGAPPPAATDAVLLIEVDGAPAAVADEAARVGEACAGHGARECRRADDPTERARLWAERRELSLVLRELAPRKINHDVVVPRGQVPALFRVVDELRTSSGLPMPCFGHVGDGNIHVNILVDPSDHEAMSKAAVTERRLFERVVALGGSISGEHGIGFAKAPFLELELSAEVVALMRRVKQAFDPNGILNPGKIFPDPGP